VDFAFTEEAEAVRDLAEQVFTGSTSVERVKEIEASDERIDRELWKELASTGLLGIGLPEAHGGAGLGLVEVCLVLQAQGRQVAPVPYWPTVIAAQTIAEFGTDEQQARWLPAVGAGDAVLTVALEPPSGILPRNAVAGAVEDEEGWTLNGESPSVPALHVADAVLVPGTIGVAKPEVWDHEQHGGTRWFMVETSDPGVSFETAITTSRAKVGHLTLHNAKATLLGGRGHEAMDFAHERALVALAAISLGACEEATRLAAEYTSTREQFGKPLSTNQGVVLKAADAYIAMNAMRATLWQAAWRLDEGLEAEKAVEVAHWWASDGGHRVVHITQHLHGGMGADIDYPVHRYFLWAKEITDLLGGPSAHLARLGDLIAQETETEEADA
jgi:alkylation response protein AidB-like acyl-CoA dehydrogenase